MFRRFFPIFFLILGPLSGVCAAESGVKKASLGVSYLALFGDLHDYFKDGFAYSLSGEWPLVENFLGQLSVGASLEWVPLKSDDTRESSQLRMLSLNAGVDQVFVRSAWYTLVGTVRPEFSYWWLKNKMSSSYAAFDKGSLWGLTSGIINLFELIPNWEVSLFALAHIPRLSITNYYFDVGLGLAKSW